jgi:HSP20 family protein
MNRDDTPAEELAYRVPAVDIDERAEGMVLLADLPGVEEENLDVQVENQVLKIEGKRPVEKVEGRTHLDELGDGNFYREFRLSEDLDAGGIQASLRHGVLRLEIPKSDRLKPRSIPVKID